MDQLAADEVYHLAASAFDALAADYDQRFEHGNRLGRLLRARSLLSLDESLPAGLILDIGCGAGREAAWLAGRGRQVVGIDISPAMIEAAKTRAQRMKVGERLRFFMLPAGRVADIAALTGHSRFDGAYSTFGALNCEPDLAGFVGGIADLLPAGAPLHLMVMNRWYAWECLWFLTHQQPAIARRRWAGWVDAEVAAGQNCSVRYYSFQELRSLLSPHFEVEQVRAFTALLPPPYLAEIGERHPQVLRVLAVLDRLLADRRPLSLLGDHLEITCRRRSNGRTAIDYA